MQYIYFSTVDGDMVDNYELVRMAKVMNNVNIDAEDFDKVRKLAKMCNGICKEINPSVKYLVEYGRKFKAVQIYHRRHPELSLRDCKDIIDKMVESLIDKEKEDNYVG